MQNTPIAIRSRVALSRGTNEWIRSQLSSKLEHADRIIERGTVRFEDLNGPKGGIDTICRIKLVLSGRPSVQVEERAEDARTAFSRALPVIARTLGRERKKHGLRGNPRSRKAAHGKRGRTTTSEAEQAGEIIGRRVGRGRRSLTSALARPEKKRRDAYVDTAEPGVSQSDRKAGGFATARRNSKSKPRRATAALEDSRTKPSRKSTRRSANRGKPSQGKERTALGRHVTSSARAARAVAHRR